ncbi:MAG: hypothetical protein JWQ49_6408 [Edaphobacter sp.]|nr:hypothetical protein [Edaphobacter sp.]
MPKSSRLIQTESAERSSVFRESIELTLRALAEKMLDAIHVFILKHIVEAHSYERCFDGLSGWGSQTQKRDRTRVLEYSAYLTQTLYRDRSSG